MISRDNYESYLIDYLDGALTPQLKAEVDTFLLLNPDLAIEFEGLEQVSVSAPSAKFKGKKQLKKSYFNEFGVDTELDYLCIAELENDINSLETSKLEHLTSTQAEAQKIRATYAKTKLVPDSNIIFDKKKQLKQYSINTFKLNFYRVAAVAAVLALTWGIYRWNISNTSVVSAVPETVAVVTETQSVVDLNDEVKNVEVNTEVVAIVQVESESISRTKIIDAIESSAIANDNVQPRKESEVRALNPIKPINPTIRTTQISSNELKAINLRKDVKIEAVQAEQQTIYAQNGNGKTKEYTLKDVALVGAMKIGEFLGIKSDVEYNKSGKVTRVKVKSNLIAFSSTYKRNELRD